MVATTVLIVNESNAPAGSTAPVVGITTISTDINPTLPPKILLQDKQPFVEAIDVNAKGGKISLSFLRSGASGSAETVLSTFNPPGGYTEWTIGPTSFASRDLGAIAAPVTDKNGTISTHLLQFYFGGTWARWVNANLQKALPSAIASLSSTEHTIIVAGNPLIIKKFLIDPANVVVVYGGRISNGSNDGFTYRVVVNVKKISMDVNYWGTENTFDLLDVSLMASVANKGTSLKIQELLFSMAGSIGVGDGTNDYPFVTADMLSGILNSNAWYNAVLIQYMNTVLERYMETPAVAETPAVVNTPEWVHVLAKATSEL